MRKQINTPVEKYDFARRTLRLLLSLSLSVSFLAANAQDDDDKEVPLNISGSIDTYWRTTLNTDDNGQYNSPATSFAGGTGFNIGMANLVVGKEGEKSGFVADLVFGPRGDAAVFGSVLPGNNDGIVNQLYAYWMPSDNVTLTIGNFNTFLGYEVIQPPVNFNYSTSYMFSYGPFSHTGIKADFSLSDNLSMMVAIMNPTDATTTTSVNTPSFGWQLGYTGDKGGAWLNILTGDQDGTLDTSNFTPSPIDTSLATSSGWYFQVDLTTGWDLTDQFYLGFNGTYTTIGPGNAVVSENGELSVEDRDADANAFMGSAVYLQYAFTESFELGLRTEYFAESNGGVGAIGAYDEDGNGNVVDVTLSSNIHLGDLTLIPEIRGDFTSEDAFVDKDGEATSSLFSFQVAAVYGF